MELFACIIPINCICGSDEGVVGTEAEGMIDRMDHFVLVLYHFYIAYCKRRKKYVLSSDGRCFDGRCFSEYFRFQFSIPSLLSIRPSLSKAIAYFTAASASLHKPIVIYTAHPVSFHTRHNKLPPVLQPRNLTTFGTPRADFETTQSPMLASSSIVRSPCDFHNNRDGVKTTWRSQKSHRKGPVQCSGVSSWTESAIDVC